MLLMSTLFLWWDESVGQESCLGVLGGLGVLDRCLRLEVLRWLPWPRRPWLPSLKSPCGLTRQQQLLESCLSRDVSLSLVWLRWPHWPSGFKDFWLSETARGKREKQEGV